MLQAEIVGIVIPNAINPTDIINIKILAPIFEYTGNAGAANIAQMVRFGSVMWSDSPSTFVMRDGIFDSATDAWRIFDSGGDCKEDTPAALETCINAKRTTPVDFTNNRQIVPGLSGLTATAGAATTLTDTDVAPAWTTNQWAGAVVRLTSGAGINQGRRVVSNTPTVLTISPAWATNPAAADTYTLTFYGDSNGYCDVAHDADCEGNAGMSSPSDYTVEFTERTSIPAFIAGRKLVRFVGTPGYNPNAGRQTAPWGCGIGPELALLPALRWARRGNKREPAPRASCVEGRSQPVKVGSLAARTWWPLPSGSHGVVIGGTQGDLKRRWIAARAAAD